MWINVNNTIKIMNKLYKKKIPIIPNMIYHFNRVFYTCDIRPNLNLDSNVIFPHNALGVVLHHNSKVGQNTKVLHNVTLGGNMDKTRIYKGEKIDSPIIGENVLIGVGAIIIGPVIIGNNAIIGAGSVVTKDVKAGKVVRGLAAKSID